VVQFILSTPSVDREGDDIAAEGWDIRQYLANPVVLFAHAHQELPVGKALSTWVEGSRLQARDQFATAEEYPFADTVYCLLKGGYLNACSVGFNPKEWTQAANRENGISFLKQELLEHSVVPVPAHPDALVVARSKGINTAPMRAWAENALDLLNAAPKDPRLELLTRLRAQSDPDGRKLFTVLSDLKLPSSKEGVDVADVVASAEQLVVDDDTPATGTPATVETPVADPELVVEDPAPVRLTVPESLRAVLTAAPETGMGHQLCDVTFEDGRTLSAVSVTNAETFDAPAEFADAVVAAVVPTPAPPAGEIVDVVLERADPVRWNRRLSKAFDVARTQFEAATSEQALVSRYLDLELKHVERHVVNVMSVRVGQYCAAIDDVVRGWSIDDVRNLNYEGKEEPPLYEAIQLNSKLTSTFLVDGMRFMRDTTADVKATLRVEPRWYGMDITVYGAREHGTALALLNQIASRAGELCFLKGEAFALSGEFLPKTAETTNELFLDAKNAKAIDRVVDLINSRGAALENRGMILCGPPGTGKTLSGRIIRNTAKATFIWVSSRDFHYAGSFHGIADAFELARELAPSVVFFEDIDNWLTETSIDLVKTEMDGIARSSGVVTILTTNFPELLPKALIDRPGRFHDVLRFDLPDETVRATMLERWMPEISTEARAAAVTETVGYSGAHLRELARFASIIRDQDGLDADTAVRAALAKLKEQRDLITSVQSHGSRYRAPEAVLTRRRGAFVAKSVEAQATPVVDPSDTVSPVAPVAVELVTDPAPVELNAFDPAAFEAHLADPLVRDLVATILTSHGEVMKAGRTLSKANEAILQTILSAMDETVESLEESEDVSAATVSRLRKASDALRTMLATMTTADPAQAGTAAAVAKEDDHILTLDEELELGDIDTSLVREAVREHIMLTTGRVD
jgi:HK97 family phage prohead protease